MTVTSGFHGQAMAVLTTITGGKDSGTFNSSPTTDVDGFTILTDTTKARTVDEFAGRTLYVTGGLGFTTGAISTAYIKSNTATTLNIEYGVASYDSVLNTLNPVITDNTSEYFIAHNCQDVVDVGGMTIGVNGEYISTQAFTNNNGYFGENDAIVFFNHFSLVFGAFDNLTFFGGKYQFGNMHGKTLDAQHKCYIEFNNIPNLLLPQPNSYLGVYGGVMKGFDTIFLNMIICMSGVTLDVDEAVSNFLVIGLYIDVTMLGGKHQLAHQPIFDRVTISGGRITADEFFHIKNTTLIAGSTIGKLGEDDYYIINSTIGEGVKIDWFDASFGAVPRGTIQDITGIKLKTFDSSLSNLGGIKFLVKDANGNAGIIMSKSAPTKVPVKQFSIETDVSGDYVGPVDRDGEILVTKRELNIGATVNDTVITNLGPFVISSGKYGYKSQVKNSTLESAVVENLFFDINSYVTVSKATAGTYSSKISINGTTKTITITSNTSIEELYDYSQYWFFDADNMQYNEPLLTNDGNNFSSDYNIVLDNSLLTGTGLIDLSTNNLTLTGTGDTDLTIKYISGTYTSITFTGLQTNTEVRVYRDSDSVELAGVENSGTSFTYKYTWSIDVPVFVMIHNIQYNNLKVDISLTEDKTSIPIQQIFDRNYTNP